MKVSFIHSGNPEMGSYRLRAQIPAKELGASLNNPLVDVLVLSKPMEHELSLLDSGKTVIVDFCDPHFINFPHYREFLRRGYLITCSSSVMAQIIASQGRKAFVIPDCWDNEQAEPHFSGTNLVWFGHFTNLPSIQRVRQSLSGYGLRTLCNAPGCEPLTQESRNQALALADIVVIPATEAYKNPNRAVTAIRAGCLVVAEPHPAFAGFPVYVGDIKEGIEWAMNNPNKALDLIRKGQAYVCERYSPKTVASAWRTAIQSACTLAAANTVGKTGPTATSQEQTSTVTYEHYHSTITMPMPPLPSTLSSISSSGRPQPC